MVLWLNDENIYDDYTTEGIVFKEYASYRKLFDLIINCLGINLNSKFIKIEYKIEVSSMPVEIHNDMGVRVYVLIKKEINESEMYSFYVSVFNKDIKNTVANSTFDKEEG